MLASANNKKYEQATDDISAFLPTTIENINSALRVVSYNRVVPRKQRFLIKHFQVLNIIRFRLVEPKHFLDSLVMWWNLITNRMVE